MSVWMPDKMPDRMLESKSDRMPDRIPDKEFQYISQTTRQIEC